MKRKVLSCLAVALLWAVCAAGQSRSIPPGPSAPADIRQVDFLEFTYPSALCSREFGHQGIGKTVRVHQGEFKNQRVYFSVDEQRILYGDLSGDGIDEAVVPVNCGAIGANFSRSEVYIYTISKGRATLLGEISDKDMERDYRQYYPDAETYWGEAGNALTIRGDAIEIEALVDGSHAAPKYIARMGYRFSGKGFRTTGKPERRDASQ